LTKTWVPQLRTRIRGGKKKRGSDAEKIKWPGGKKREKEFGLGTSTKKSDIGHGKNRWKARALIQKPKVGRWLEGESTKGKNPPVGGGGRGANTTWGAGASW